MDVLGFPTHPLFYYGYYSSFKGLANCAIWGVALLLRDFRVLVSNAHTFI